MTFQSCVLVGAILVHAVYMNIRNFRGCLQLHAKAVYVLYVSSLAINPATFRTEW